MGGWLSYFEPTILISNSINDISMISPNHSSEYENNTIKNQKMKRKIVHIQNVKSFNIFKRPKTSLETIYEDEEDDIVKEENPFMEEDTNNIIYYKTDLESIYAISKLEYYHANKKYHTNKKSSPIPIKVSPKK